MLAAKLVHHVRQHAMRGIAADRDEQAGTHLDTIAPMPQASGDELDAAAEIRTSAHRDFGGRPKPADDSDEHPAVGNEIPGLIAAVRQRYRDDDTREEVGHRGHIASE